jgi:hypothetical protein
MRDEDLKKKLSGYQNLIRKRKREEERDRNSTKISRYFTTLPSTSKQLSESNQSIQDVVGPSKNTSYSGKYFIII